MKINEICGPLKHYLATVRIVLRGASCSVRTIISAESANDARKLLEVLVGNNNVLSLSHIVSEAPQTAQIQREASINPQLVRRQVQSQKIAQIQPSKVQKQRKRQVSTKPVADPLKHQIVQNRLTKQLMRQSNIVKPTVDDIEIAKSRAKTAQKRVDLEFKKQAEEQLRRRRRNAK